MSNRLDKEREAKLQPTRVQKAVSELEKLGISCVVMDTYLMFEYGGYIITFYPYSGWHTGKSIKDGRGLQNLLKQLI